MIEDVTGLTLAASHTEVYKINNVNDVVLKKFSLKQTIPGANAKSVKFIYKNLYPNFTVNGISLGWTTNIKLQNLKIISAGSHPIAIINSYGAMLSNIYINGAWNKGKEGNGYLRLSRSYRSQLNDISVLNIRHIAIQWSSAFNQLEDIAANVDINFHGGFSHHNTVRDAHIVLSSEHKWPPVYRTPNDARWAPPDGVDNKVIRLNTTAPLDVAEP
jgi:glycosyltransferase Alg8